MEIIISKEIYDQALKLFNVEIRRAGKVYFGFVTDENGNPIRHPPKMGDFEERTKFHLIGYETLAQHQKQHFNTDQTGLTPGILKSLVLKELILLPIEK